MQSKSHQVRSKLGLKNEAIAEHSVGLGPKSGLSFHFWCCSLLASVRLVPTQTSTRSHMVKVSQMRAAGFDVRSDSSLGSAVGHPSDHPPCSCRLIFLGVARRCFFTFVFMSCKDMSLCIYIYFFSFSLKQDHNNRASL